MKIAYTGNFPYPGSTAASARVEGVARALTGAGHTVDIYPLAPRDDSAVPAGIGIDQQYAQPRTEGRLHHQKRILLGRMDSLDDLAGTDSPYDIVIVYGTPTGALLKLLSRPSRHFAPAVVLDVVEWYSYRDRPGGPLGPLAFEHWLAMNKVAPRFRHFITISKFLADYFDSKGGATVRVPPLATAVGLSVAPPRPPGSRIRVAYAGSPGKKDLPGLVNLVEGLNRLPAGVRDAYEVDIVGLSEQQGRQILPSIKPGPIVRMHGRLDRAQARRVVAGSDFSFLQRPQQRYSRAGFPTKVVESLVVGTPVIGNCTSDLGDYLDHGRNAVVLEEFSPSGTDSASVERALAWVSAAVTDFRGGRQDVAMRAESDFSPATYSPQVDRFVREAADHPSR